MRTSFIVLLLATAGFSGAVLPPGRHAKKPPHHAATGWQPGGPLTPLYREAVKDIHAHQFDQAEDLCRQGLKLHAGDAAFTDLLGQIPQWRRDALQAQITSTYKDALILVQQGHLDAGERRCQDGLKLEPGNKSFTDLLDNIAQRRNVRLQAALLKCYKESSLLLARGHAQRAEARCREGLQLSPHDVVLRSLLARIRKHENVD